MRPLPEDREYLFVYGTLRKCPDTLDYRNQRMHHFLVQHADLAGKGTMIGRLYHIGEYPGAVLSPPAFKATPAAPDRQSAAPCADIVHGELYVLRDPAFVLEVLDEYEGCGPDDQQPTEFRRERTTIFLENGQEVIAWVYLYNWPTSGLKVIRSGDYLS
ncbi:MAG: gamma-glutamylcyclotransferase family protein [bacterium]